MIIASGADLESMNSLVTTHPLAKQIQRYALLMTLVRYDSTLGVTPYLAKTWQWSRDSLVLTLTLRNDVKWHDGTSTTADDAAWTLEAARDPATGYPRLRDLGSLAETIAENDTTLLLRFTTRQSHLSDVLADLAILPSHLLREVPPSEMRRAPWNERPIGNGPFRFVRHEPNQSWTFEANRDFPVALGGRPRLDRFVVAVVDEPMTKLAALASAELDFAGIQPAHAEFVRHDPRLEVLEYPTLFSYVMVFNARRPPFDRPDVRRAMSIAIDRLALVSGVLFGFGTPAAGPLSRGLAGEAESKPVYAPGRGRAMLGSRPLAFELLTVGSGEAALEQMIQQQLARIGVTVTIRQLELATFLERVYTAHDFDAAVTGISVDLERGYLGSLFDLAGLSAPERSDRGLQAFADSVPATFLYHARGLQGMNRRVRDVRMDLRGELATLPRWRVQ